MKTTHILDAEAYQQKSKSQVKRELLALHELGRELVELPGKVLRQIPISDVMREAISEARYLKMEALRRQLKHIGKLIRDEDAEAIRVALATLRKPHEEEVTVFHEVESWRDKLLDASLISLICCLIVSTSCSMTNVRSASFIANCIGSGAQRRKR